MSNLRMEESWKKRLASEFETERMRSLRAFLLEEMRRGRKIYPRPEEWFAAFDLTPFERVKVVIVGQDPYHGPGQAHGLCFSVRPGVRFPPSLQNIFQELKGDLEIPLAKTGCLEPWAKQGVLLINSVLTVEEGKAASHQGRGWEEFTDQVIRVLNEERSNLVFLLWGAYAQKKAAQVDRQKHFVLEAPHPSPLSAHRGFFGSRPFSKINAYLRSKGIAEIDWRLEP